MCRWLAYNGGALPLAELAFNARNSLIDQSLAARSGNHTTNGDGFGVGWYGEPATPGLYRSTQPAWNDPNLYDLCQHVRSPLFMAHIRASTGTPIQHSNCHPFRKDHHLFVHNGVINEFMRIRRSLCQELNDEHFRSLLGTTDSELMFLLAMQSGLAQDPHRAVARMVGRVETIGWEADIEHPMVMTLGISDGEKLYAVRYASDGDAPTLYHSPDLESLSVELGPLAKERLEQMGANARCIVSEPLSEHHELWTAIPVNSFVTVHQGEVQIEEFTPLH